MKTTRQQRLFLPFLLVLTTSMAPTRVFAAEEDISRNDPPRWYQLDDTPKQHYQNLLKEAHAAYGQALQECKALQASAARSCRQLAHRNLQDDRARARRILDLLNHK